MIRLCLKKKCIHTHKRKKLMSMVCLDAITKLLTANVSPGWQRKVSNSGKLELYWTQTRRSGLRSGSPRRGRHRDVAEPQTGDINAGWLCSTERKPSDCGEEQRNLRITCICLFVCLLIYSCFNEELLAWLAFWWKHEWPTWVWTRLNVKGLTNKVKSGRS